MIFRVAVSAILIVLAQSGCLHRSAGSSLRGDDSVGKTSYANVYQVASHNTYENYGPADNWAGALDRSPVLEFDTWPYASWRVAHTPPAFDSAVHPIDPQNGSFKSLVTGQHCYFHLSHCLQKVRDWHDQYPNHDPITIWIEIKSDQGFNVPDINGMLCGPERHSSAGDRSSKYDAVFACRELYRPGDLLYTNGPGSKASSLREAANLGKWPSLEQMRGKIIFVMNGVAPSLQKYLRETNLTQDDNADRKVASAFIATQATGQSDILGTPGLVKGMPEHAGSIVFYNAECDTWVKNPEWGRAIREKNYLSRGYYCHTDRPNLYLEEHVGVAKLNFIAHDKLESGFPQGSYSSAN